MARVSERGPIYLWTDRLAFQGTSSKMLPDQWIVPETWEGMFRDELGNNAELPFPVYLQNSVVVIVHTKFTDL
ncbi:hypothetical protein MRX96_032295 [Rhipicephalus microplus]